jgi:rubrerythrin
MNDEVRLNLRHMGATANAEHRAMATTMQALFESSATAQQRRHAVLGRRSFLQIGGFSVATAAVLAACGGNDGGGLARVGNAPTVPLPDPIINDGVLLRTASSLEHSAIAVYDLVIGNADLLDPSLDDVAKRFRDDHAGHAALFEKLTSQIGAQPWTCSNPRIDEFVVGPVLKAITGAAATEDAAAVAATDDPKRDVLYFAHGLESLAGATYQALVPLLSDPAMRKESITIGTHEVRHAALLALVITGRPDGYVPPVETPVDPPEFPAVYAVPSTYGSLGAQQVVLGAPNESGVRTTFNLDTPSLNTFVYDYMTPSC